MTESKSSIPKEDYASIINEIIEKEMKESKQKTQSFSELTTNTQNTNPSWIGLENTVPSNCSLFKEQLPEISIQKTAETTIAQFNSIASSSSNVSVAPIAIPNVFQSKFDYFDSRNVPVIAPTIVRPTLSHLSSSFHIRNSEQVTAEITPEISRSLDCDTSHQYKSSTVKRKRQNSRTDAHVEKAARTQEDTSNDEDDDKMKRKERNNIASKKYQDKLRQKRKASASTIKTLTENWKTKCNENKLLREELNKVKREKKKYENDVTKVVLYLMLQLETGNGKLKKI